MKNWNIALSFVVVASLSSPACSGNVAEGDSETHWVACKTTDDCPGAKVCEERVCVAPETASARDPLWGCLGGATAPDDGVDASMTFMLRDMLVRRGVSGARTKLCPQTDPVCSDSAVAPLESDVNGDVTLTVPANYDGYVYFAPAQPTQPQRWPTIYGLSRSARAAAGERVVEVVDTDLVSALASAVGVTKVPGTALVMFDVRNCKGDAASGVSFEASSADMADVGATFYAIKALPSADAVETDDSGMGFLLNVPTGRLTVRAVLNDGTDRQVGQARLVVQPDTLTRTSIAPGDL